MESVAIFFVLMFLISTWWTLEQPTAYEVNGRTAYAFPGSNELYDENGHHVGDTNSGRTKAVLL